MPSSAGFCQQLTSRMILSAWSSQVLLLPTEEDGNRRPSSRTAATSTTRDVELAEKAEPDELRDVGEVDVDIVHLRRR